ncbi:putative rhamnogalacturonase A [Diplonema papillatum]|nr:putative rhamnogalacturonase A [Diplonema papillatum]
MLRLHAFFAVAAAAAVHAAPDCDILSHGAVCDGTTDDTNAIQAAIDACVGGGHVVFAADKNCMTYPLKLAGNNSLYFPAGSIIRAAGMDNWPSGEYYNLFSVTHASNISVFGTGTIDGNGQAWWPTEPNNRPRMFHMQYVSDISIKGVTLINSPMMTIVLNSPCERAYIEDVTIWNYAVGQTDGIDFGCDGGLIRNVSVTNGDDSLCMKSGAKNVLIVNSTTQQGPPYPTAAQAGRADGLVLGTSVNNSMYNVTYRNCTATGTLRGITFKFRPTQNGTVSDIMFENIRIVDPQAYAVDIDINSDHFMSSAEEKEAVHQRAMRQRATGKFEPSAREQASLGTVHVNNVVIRNVTGRATTPGVFKCNDAPYNCMNITLEDFHFTNYTDPACTWVDAYGSGSNVEPASCMPPAYNDTSV